MAPSVVAEDGLAGSLAEAVNDGIKVEPPRAQWENDDESTGDETSGDDSSDSHGAKNKDAVDMQELIQGSYHEHPGDAQHLQGHARQTTGDEGAVHADVKELKVQGQEDRVPCTGEVNDARSKISMNEITVNTDLESPKAKGKKRCVSWADEPSDDSGNACGDKSADNADSVPVSARGLLKQKLGRSKARQWLLSKALQGDGRVEPEMTIAIIIAFRRIREEEGAGDVEIYKETSKIIEVLTPDLFSRVHRKQIEDFNAMVNCLLNGVLEWVKWYTLIVLRVA
uniref:Uncharacterized protein n=1 Tax=Pyrodinium bahamense TaxID=73915 RepID=A0A7S0A1Y8_9DINO|mmetsp:Transcript_19128/g.52559  ORF Transcript_19128/g.52559 Transcript_19128/m.52559 type:complete len:283 (+) Transcript_19128:75-923(+)